MNPLQVATRYFELSNASDLDAIAKLLTDITTYSSPTTGIFLGRNEILQMQRDFHHKFVSLHWSVNSVKELKPGIVLFEYDFTGELSTGKKVHSSGNEYVIVHDGKIQHIEIRSKVETP